MTCPSGKAFNHTTSQCEEASTVNCYETMDHHHMHHHHKRSLEEYHTISIEAIKNKVVEFYSTIRPMVMSAMEEVAPSIYAKFETDILPSLRFVNDGVMPYFRLKIWPQIQKLSLYIRRMTARLIEKAYMSYELSNSTHIIIAPMSDITSDVSNHLKPVIDIGRYMSARMMQNTRAKRSVDDFAIPPLFADLVQPMVRNVYKTVGATFIGEANSLTSKVILPITYEMLGDEETRFDLMKVMFSAKAAFTPFVWQMLSHQTYNTPEGTIITIPRQLFDSAVSQFQNETKPIIHKILGKHLSMILRHASQHVPLIMEAVDNLHNAKNEHRGILRDGILNFIIKHGAVLQTSDSRYVKTYTLTEIKKDLTPIYATLLQVGMDYFGNSPNSWIGMLFDRDSLLSQSIIGTSVYAKPAFPATAQRSSPISKQTRVSKLG